MRSLPPGSTVFINSACIFKYPSFHEHPFYPIKPKIVNYHYLISLEKWSNLKCPMDFFSAIPPSFYLLHVLSGYRWPLADYKQSGSDVRQARPGANRVLVSRAPPMLLYPVLTPTSSHSQVHYIHRSQDCNYSPLFGLEYPQYPQHLRASNTIFSLKSSLQRSSNLSPTGLGLFVAVTNVIVTIRKGDIFHPCVSEDLTSLRHSMWLNISLSFIVYWTFQDPNDNH